MIDTEEYKKIINDILLNIINIQKEEINRKLRIFNKYDEKFDSYFENIKLLNEENKESF